MPQVEDEAALDTNSLRSWIDGDSLLIERIGERRIAIPSIVVLEALSGWQLLLTQHQRRSDERRFAQTLSTMIQLIEYLNQVRILDYCTAAQVEFATLRRGRGSRSRNDLRIAATCIAHDVPLITRNVRDFDDLPGLCVETW
jgi:tRNA(fMet)-specific endonuclease VapC